MEMVSTETSFVDRIGTFRAAIVSVKMPLVDRNKPTIAESPCSCLRFAPKPSAVPLFLLSSSLFALFSVKAALFFS